MRLLLSYAAAAVSLMVAGDAFAQQHTQQAAPTRPVTSHDLEPLSSHDIETVIQETHAQENAKLESIVNKDRTNNAAASTPQAAPTDNPRAANNPAPVAERAVETPQSPVSETQAVKHPVASTVEAAALAPAAAPAQAAQPPAIDYAQLQKQFDDMVKANAELAAKQTEYAKKLASYLKWLTIIGAGQLILLATQLMVLSKRR